MKWTPGGSSSDVEDRRGQSGGGGGFSFGGRSIGCGGFLLLLVLSIVFKKNFFALLSTDGGSGTQAPSVATDSEHPAPATRESQFVNFAIDDIQKTWDQVLKGRYQHAKLVLFTDATSSSCGFARSASGPFYCPEDQKVYLDLGFFQQLKGQLGAGGEFAQAYVIAHEVGHHVQDLMGLLGKVHAEQESGDKRRASDLSVRTELQADCLAGVWAHSTQERGILESGDIESGMNAAAAVGDDRLQKMSTGRVQPESFTHGSSEQRVRWFKTGMASGNPNACDTFSVQRP
ncbi:MAG: neutral zinc metallopeptidase [Thermoanaerobaculia bacterium]